MIGTERIAFVCTLIILFAAQIRAATIAKKDLDSAPAAEVRNLGVAQRLARVSGWSVSPATPDYPARLLVGFYSFARRGECETWVVDLSTGAFRRVTAPGFDKDTLRWPHVRDETGREYFSCSKGALAIYDPRADKFKMVRPIPKATWLRGLALGGDGAVYCSDYPTGSAARYDPETGEIEYYGPQGGPFKITRIYGYSVGSDGEWVYTACGKIPWYVTALHRKTREQKTLFKLDQRDYPGVSMRGKEVYLITSIWNDEKKKHESSWYHFKDGQAVPFEGYPSKVALKGPWIGTPQPHAYYPESRGLEIDAKGAVVWYRPPQPAEKPGVPVPTPPSEETGWRKVHLPVQGDPYEIRRLGATDDGRILLATGNYGNVYFYDPRSGRFEDLGNPARHNVYALLYHKEKVYFAGYPQPFIGVYENGQGVIKKFWNELGCKRSVSLALGADGFIYAGLHAEREFVGGGIGWWHPETGESGGVQLRNDECWNIASVLGGKYVVAASRVVPDPTHPEIEARAGNLIVVDTAAKKIVKTFSPLPEQKSRGSAGRIVEARPGVVLGLSDVNGEPTMYVARIPEGDVTLRRGLPARVTGDLERAPDGKLYTFLDKTLVRIDPETFQITPVCKAEPGRMAFLGADLYLGSQSQLRRIEGVAK